MMRPVVIMSILIIGFWLTAAAVSHWRASAIDGVDLQQTFEQPSTSHLFGFDDLGRDIGARLLAGAKISCSVAFAVVSAALLFGTLYGTLIAWFGGAVDLIGVRIIDVFLAFPGILLAIALAAVLGPGIDNIFLALVAVSWVGFARLARAQTLSVKNRDHVRVAIALGTATPVIVARHILPLIAAPLIVEATFAIAAVIIAEAGLSFLGLGVQPPTPSWGTMIKQGTQYLLVAPHMVIGPGIALLSMVFAINILGDWLRDRLQIRENQLR